MKSAISVQNISKQYTLGSEAVAGQSFREMVMGSLKAPLQKFKRLSGADEQQEKFWALKDVSFEVQPGEIVGIIGRNGAGKSTLLKVLSRITTPTKGVISYKGRLASLLEVGTGFHPELTGRENIYLNGAILGMTKTEITQRMNEIVAFAGIEKFLDTPVKRYSSGMYVRLAFSVAAHLDPDILIVDEVLSVGDAKFQNKCIGKMSEVATEGRTVLFVSHNLGAVRKLCTSVKILDQGRMTFEGDVAQGMEVYEESIGNHFESVRDAKYKGTLCDVILFDSIRYMQERTQVQFADIAKEITIILEGTCQKSIAPLELSIHLYRDGMHIASLYDTESKTDLVKGNFRSTFRISKHALTPGRYTICVGTADCASDWSWGEDIAVLNATNLDKSFPVDRTHGVVNIAYQSERLTQK